MCIINTVKQEFEQAIREKRQPNCPYCRQPLTVGQVLRDLLRWEWSHAQQRFVKATEGDADEPHCVRCGVEDDNFLACTSEASGLCETLGLDY